MSLPARGFACARCSRPPARSSRSSPVPLISARRTACWPRSSRRRSRRSSSARGSRTASSCLRCSRRRRSSPPRPRSRDAARTSRSLRSTLATLLVVTAQAFRGERVPWGSWRDYVALTKPRIMSLLLVTGFCGMIAGARGWPGTAIARLGDGRPRARVRRRERAEPRARPRHRPADGRADEAPPGRIRPREREPRARVRARAVRVLVRPARKHGQRAHRSAGARRQPLLRPRVHALAEALDAAEHRHRRRGGRGAAARRLGGRDGRRDVRGAPPLRDRLRLDAAALLGARAR